MGFEPTDPGCGLRTFIQEAIGAASTCWEDLSGTGVFDSTRAAEIADAVYERAMSPEGARLGMATTRELLEELKVRVAINWPGGLDYRTVDK